MPNVPIYNITDTWNAGGSTYKGIQLNVTDTASAAASRLLDLQIGGVSKFAVSKEGNLNMGGIQVLSYSGGIASVGVEANTKTQLYGNVHTSTGNTGAKCNFVGSGAGLNNSAASCVAFGYRALYSSNSGGNNGAFGVEALYSNTSGLNNFAVGYRSLYANTTGNYNFAMGNDALRSNITSSYNIAVGYSALYSNTTGFYNIAIGSTSGRYQTGGTVELTDANRSIFIGENTKGVAAANNQIVIGDTAESLGANTVVLGNASIVTTALRGNVGIGTTAPNANAILDVTSTTKAFMPPRMTTTQKNAVASPTAGMVVYDSTLNKLAVYTGAGWEAVTSA